MTGCATHHHLAGSVALLLWATRMVRTGVERGCGDMLRRKLRGTLNNALLAYLVLEEQGLLRGSRLRA